MSQPADHTSRARGAYSPEWGTPPEILDLVRTLYGPIDIDLASNDEANKLVQAREYFTRERPCPRVVWGACEKTVWCNPPGPGYLVRDFWDKWCDLVWRRGNRGGFLIFKQDHWRQLPPPPIPVVAVVLRRRLRFVGAGQSASFPSTLILTPYQLALQELDPATLHGHVMRWGPR